MQSILKKKFPILILGFLIEFSASSLTLFKANNVLFDSDFVIAAETPGDNNRYFLYTDGIIEASNAAGERFGWGLLKEFIASQASLPVGQFADELIQRVSRWSGKHSEETLDDDLTLVVADFENS